MPDMYHHSSTYSHLLHGCVALTMISSYCSLQLLVLVLLLAASTSTAASPRHLQLKRSVAVSPPYPHQDVVRILDRPSFFSLRSDAASPSPSSSASPTNYSSWMSDNLPLLHNLTLLSVTLPGSHDSASFTLSQDLGPLSTGSAFLDAVIHVATVLHLPVADVLIPWSLSQSASLYTQALSGSRYFDLRAAWNGSDWRCYHGLLGISMQEAMDELMRFLTHFGQEVMVVEVSHLAAVDGVKLTAQAVQQLIDLLLSSAGSLLFAPPDQRFDSVTIGEMISSKQRLVLSVSVDQLSLASASSSPPGSAEAAFPSSLLNSSALYNTYADTPSLPAMLLYDNLTLHLFTASLLLPDPFAASHTSLFKLSYTLTPDADTILDSLFPGQPTSLKQLSAQAGAALTRTLTGWRQSGLMLGQVLLMDFFDYRLVDQVLLQLYQRTAGEAAVPTAQQL